MVLDPDERNEIGKELVWLFPHTFVPLDHYRNTLLIQLSITPLAP